jgi:hypothetical protein
MQLANTSERVKLRDERTEEPDRDLSSIHPERYQTRQQCPSLFIPCAFLEE